MPLVAKHKFFERQDTAQFIRDNRHRNRGALGARAPLPDFAINKKVPFKVSRMSAIISCN